MEQAKERRRKQLALIQAKNNLQQNQQHHHQKQTQASVNINSPGLCAVSTSSPKNLTNLPQHLYPPQPKQHPLPHPNENSPPRAQSLDPVLLSVTTV